MKYRLLLPLALAACYLACDSANPVAPGGTSLTIIANPTLIALTGEAATITVTGFRPDGNPLFPGTQVRLTTDLGTLDDDLLEIGSGGRAQTQLRGDGKSGPATVQAFIATSGGGGGGDGMGGGGGGTGTASVVVQIGDDDTTRPTIALTASPSTAALGEQVQVIATLRNADGSIFTGGGNVLFETSLGTLSATSAPVGGDGRATTTLSVGDQVGTAVVTASFGSATPATIDIVVENQRPTLILTANPSTIPVLTESVITILARDNNNFPLGAGQRIDLFADLGTVPASVLTDETGRAEAVFLAGDQAGNGSVTATLANSDPVTVQITIRDAAASITLIANPTSVERTDGGETVTLSATVLNAQGEPVGSQRVIFESPVGSLANNGSVNTNAQGTATETLTVNRMDLQGIPQGGSVIVTATVISEGVELTDSAVIQVIGAP